MQRAQSIWVAHDAGITTIMGFIPTGASHAENAQCILAVLAGILN